MPGPSARRVDQLTGHERGSSGASSPLAVIYWPATNRPATNCPTTPAGSSHTLAMTLAADGASALRRANCSTVIIPAMYE